MKTCLILYALLTACPKTVVTNRCLCSWNSHDTEVLERNKDFCSRHYKNQKCVKSFMKTDENTYHITCGLEGKSVKITQ